MRNEVFARHGYIFRSPLLVAHFSEMTWYRAERADVDALLTPLERSNVELLKDTEDDRREQQLSALPLDARRCHGEFVAAAARRDVKALERMAEFLFHDGFEHAMGADAGMTMSKKAIDRIMHVGRPAFRSLMRRLLDDVVVDALKNTVVLGVRGHGMWSSAMWKPWGYPIFQLDFGAGRCVLTGVDVGGVG